MSRCIRSSRTSFRNRDNSARSSLVRPVLPFVRSARARSTHIRRAEVVRSRSFATPATDLPSSSINRTASALNSSVKVRRARFCFFSSSMVDTVSTSSLVSTKAG
jgi:hypothetical protein